ncbi:MAG: biotin carboxylase N-terminal domain-containing protein [Acidimicrobiales bacterium]
MIESLLVANRGEIAVRIVRACRDLGIESIVAHSDLDADSPAVRLADRAVAVGDGSPRPYLDGAALITAALDTGAGAIHPGYGFLAENAPFAEMVEAAGLAFVGPAAATMALLGDKLSGRDVAERAGLPVLRGHPLGGASTVDAPVLESIGLPVLVKAAFGGGGRGMRRADSAAELDGAIEAARRESAVAFGRDEIYIERLVDRPRHVEVQIFGDPDGRVFHLGTRDCTIQRRHQKLIEEAPAAHLPADVEERMLTGAVALATEVGYRGAGTVEFLFDPVSGEFFFLEVNARLQVEHPVTELVTGVDLVRAQLVVAGGEASGLDQDAIAVRGHAIEARILAEDPAAGFQPATGLISRLTLPSGPWVRVESGVAPGSEVTAHYDSLLLKVCALGEDRPTAIARLRRALRELEVVGVPTTAAFIDAVLGSPPFSELSCWTGAIDAGEIRVPSDGPTGTVEVSPAASAVAGSGEAPTERIATINIGSSDLHIAIPVRGSTKRTAEMTRTRRERSGGRSEGAATRGAVAPMDAVLLHYLVAVGDSVEGGATVAVVESMKLETHITADRAGVVTNLHFAEGDLVRRGDVLVDVAEPEV